MGLGPEMLFDKKEIWSILQMTLPVWHSGLTAKQSKDIKKILRISFSILLGSEISYRRKCELLGAQKLDQRREKLK